MSDGTRETPLRSVRPAERSETKVRVLIVDDSAIARELLERGLSRDPGIEVVGKAEDAYAARDKIVFLKPDVLTLDVEMPRMDGIEFLRKLLPQYPIPVVVVSAVTLEGSRRALEALDAGAVAVVAKPRAEDRAGLLTMLGDLAEAVKDASRADVSKMRRWAVAARAVAAGAVPAIAGRASPAPRARVRGEGRVIAIGASTGGTAALTAIISDFPETMPGTIVVQHMPPVFTRLFAESLDKISKVEVREARDGDELRPGLVLVAPGDLHARLVERGGAWKIACAPGPKVSGHRPSVDLLFSSVATAAGDRALGLLLTGMGRDGAAGLLEMRRAGARCLAQDEASSVVFGMPKEAWALGAAERLVSLDRAVDELVSILAVPLRAGGPG
ncbi:MAG: chemotaxis response regulator protein-glutamate methylesterase [Treponema sp.]|nr:chemotaxis response regulator protein-glutamate methylesterase [Treponema sp.]